jgi:hypothetical protein
VVRPFRAGERLVYVVVRRTAADLAVVRATLGKVLGADSR